MATRSAYIKAKYADQKFCEFSVLVSHLKIRSIDKVTISTGIRRDA